MFTTTSIIEEPKTFHLTNGTVLTVKSNQSSTEGTIPVINVSRIYSDNLKDRQDLAEEIRSASRSIGFFVITNHGIDRGLPEQTIEAAKDFFALPKESKMEVYTGKMPSEFCGYHPMEEYNINGFKLKDLHEAFNWNYDASKDPDAADASLESVNMWPTGVTAFQDQLCAYQTALIGLARRLTRLFALALHLPENAFDEYVKVPEAGMRILHYPAQEASRDDQNGIGAHTDVESFTIVTQGSGGLEVLSKEGEWIKVQPIPGSFVVNIADCFMRQTNDFFVSTVHRVVNETGLPRYSAPFFWGFNRSTPLTPISTCVDAAHPPKYPVITAGEYYEWRTRRQKAQWKDPTLQTDESASI